MGTCLVSSKSWNTAQRQSNEPISIWLEADTIAKRLNYRNLDSSSMYRECVVFMVKVIWRSKAHFEWEVSQITGRVLPNLDAPLGFKKQLDIERDDQKEPRLRQGTSIRALTRILGSGSNMRSSAACMCPSRLRHPAECLGFSPDSISLGQLLLRQALGSHGDGAGHWLPATRVGQLHCVLVSGFGLGPALPLACF